MMLIDRGPVIRSSFGTVPSAWGPVEFDDAPLTLTDTPTVTDHLALSRQLTLTDTPTVTDSFRKAIELSLTDSPSVTDLLDAYTAKLLTDNPTVSDSFQANLEANITLIDATTVSEFFHLTEILLHVSDTPTVVEGFSVAKLLSLSDAPSVVEAFFVEHPVTLTDTLAIVDAFSVNKIKSLIDTPSVVDTLSPLFIITHHLSDTPTVGDGFVLVRTGSNESTCSEHYVVSLGTRTNVVLTFPFTSPSTTLQLRTPKFGNTDIIRTNTRFARTRSGQLNFVRPASWPTIETLQVSFEALSEAQVIAFRSFVQQSAAMEIGYLDHENRQWRGVIITETVDTQQVGIGCQFNTSFEFRGRLA